MTQHFRGKKVMITGHAGFLGSRLAKTLKDLGALNYGVDYREQIFIPYDAIFQKRRANFEAVFMGDVTDYLEIERLIAEWRPRFIFHLAAISQVVDAWHAPLQTYQNNIMGTANVLEAVRKSGLEIVTVVASSDKAFGRLSGLVIAHEETSLNPFHPYDVSKAAADFIARSYADIYGLRVGITRCGNIYGPGDTNWQRIIPGAVRAVLIDEPLVIRSDGGPKRVYNYVDDIIEAYLLVAEDLAEHDKNSGTSWTIAAPNDYYDVMEVVKLVESALGADTIPFDVLGGASEEESHLRLDAGKIIMDLGWKPQVSMSSGINATARWLDEYLQGTSL